MAARRVRIFEPPLSRIDRNVPWRTIRSMKTGHRLLQLPLRLVVVSVSAALTAVASSCASKPQVAKNTPYPAPHVVDVAEIVRRDSVNARARELINTGKYKTSAEARSAAEKEYPEVVNSGDSTQEVEYRRWKYQQQSQAKFEAELEKMRRKP